MGVIAGLLDLIPMVGATIAGTILVLANADAGPDAGADHARDRARLPAVRELRPAADDSRQGGQRLRVFVIFSVMIFGALLGVDGAIIAVPIIASIQIVVQEVTAGRRAQMAALRDDGKALPADASTEPVAL